MWGSEIERERRNRIRLSVYAYAYEYKNHSIVDDGTYDQLSREINPSLKTGKKRLDKFFATEYSPDTGMWIRKHPELKKVEYVYEKYYKSS